MNKKIKNIINGMLVGTMVFSMIGVAFADNQLDVAQKSELNKTRFGIEQRQDKFKSILDQIADKEILEQEQIDYISEKLAENKQQIKKLTPEERKAQLEEKVASGEITQEKADKLLERIETMGDKANSPKQGERKSNKETRQRLTPEERKVQLEEKVASGEITQEKADKLIGKMENMKANRISKLKSTFSKFVEEEIITENQLEDILELVK